MIQIGQSVHYVTRDGGEYPALVTAVFNGEQTGTIEPIVNVAIIDPSAKDPLRAGRLVRYIHHVAHESAPRVERSLSGEAVNCWRHAILDPLLLAELPELPGFDPSRLGVPAAAHGRGFMEKMAGTICDWIHTERLCPREHAHAATPFETEPAGSVADLEPGPVVARDGIVRGSGEPDDRRVGFGHSLDTVIAIPGVTDDNAPGLTDGPPTPQSPDPRSPR